MASSSSFSAADAAVLPEWLVDALSSSRFGYRGLLPVQRCVVPFVRRALDAGMPLDVCLSAPTGAGKTLCYLLPALCEIDRRRREHGGGTKLRAIVLVPSKALGRQVAAVATRLAAGTAITVGAICGDQPQAETETLLRTATLSDGTVRRYSAVDLLVATPQRLLKHLGPTEGFTLRDLCLLVVDEADEILSGVFTNFAARVVAFVEADAGRTDASVLHKVLCSATITPHIAKVADVRLQNVRFFALDGMGVAQLPEGGEDTGDADADGDAAAAKVGGAGLRFVATRFALPPRLKEHLVLVDDATRHVALLSVIRAIQAPPAEAGASVEGDASNARRRTAATNAAKAILVFCAMADSARVVGHFLALAGIPTLEFTAMATDVERRRAVLEAYSGKRRLVVVATDALMRGIDLPGVGAVVMYDAPTSLQQYIHRTGRTARANASGDAFALLSKKGPSGTLADGEVARFKAFDRGVRRAQPPVLERGHRHPAAELLEEANACLEKAQLRLRKLWASAAGGRALAPTTTGAAALAATATTTAAAAGRKRPRSPASKPAAAATDVVEQEETEE